MKFLILIVHLSVFKQHGGLTSFHHLVTKGLSNNFKNKDKVKIMSKKKSFF